MRGRKPKVWDIDDALRAYEAGASLRDIAQSYGVCLTTAHRAMVKRGALANKSLAATKHWRKRRLAD